MNNLFKSLATGDRSYHLLWRRRYFYNLYSSATPSASGSRRKRTVREKSQKPSTDVAEEQHQKPSEVVFQPKVANFVNLIGKIGLPVHLEPPQSPGGEYSATSVLVNEKSKDLPSFWVPVVFKGDLAQIAASYLREDDLVFVSGQVSGDMPDFLVKDIQTNIQVLADSVCFVQKEQLHEDEKVVSAKNPIVPKSSDIVREDNSARKLWDDLLANPRKWWDNRHDKRTPSSPDFKHKDSGELLWIDEFTPKDVLLKLDSLFSQSASSVANKRITSSVSTKKSTATESLWKELVASSEEWRDYRKKKQLGSVSEKYPDFKHMVSQESLWLNTAPDWVLSQLNDLKFAKAQAVTKNGYVSGTAWKSASSFSSKKDDNEKLWKSLVEDPQKWWDNRANKLKPNMPDFKHKETGEVLWLGSATPSWVLPKLTQVKQHVD